MIYIFLSILKVCYAWSIIIEYFAYDLQPEPVKYDQVLVGLSIWILQPYNWYVAHDYFPDTYAIIWSPNHHVIQLK